MTAALYDEVVTVTPARNAAPGARHVPGPAPAPKKATRSVDVQHFGAGATRWWTAPLACSASRSGTCTPRCGVLASSKSTA